jgi:hypothetical protein
MVATALPHLNRARHLANTVGDAALYAHLNGDDATALETIRDVRYLSRAVSEEPFLVSHLVCVGIDALALARLQIIASGLQIAPEGEADGAVSSAGAMGLLPTTRAATVRRPATVAQVRALIAELLDDRALVEGLQRVFAGERTFQLDTADWMSDSAPLLRPMFQLDAVRMLELGEANSTRRRSLPGRRPSAVLAKAAVARPLPPPPAPGAAMFPAGGAAA